MKNKKRKPATVQNVISSPPVSHNYVALVLSGILLLVFGLLALDSVGSPETSVKLMGFRAYVLIVPVLLLQMYAHRFWNVRLLNVLQHALLSAWVLLAPLTAGLTWYWIHSHENAVFELTRLHPQGLTILLLYAFLAWLINQRHTWWKQHWQLMVLVAPLLGYALLYMVSVWPFNIFKEVVKEDRVIEWLQFAVLFSGSIYSAVASWKQYAQRQWLLMLLYIGASIVFVAIAGDEISWGQRLIGIESPPELQEINRQGETTFHNLYAVEWFVIYGYVMLSFAGLASHWIARAVPPLQRIQFLTASPLLAGFFLVPFIFFVQQLRVQWGIWHSWSEVAELYLYTGLVLWVVLLRQR